jgi:hypothetical protein
MEVILTEVSMKNLRKATALLAVLGMAMVGTTQAMNNDDKALQERIAQLEQQARTRDAQIDRLIALLSGQQQAQNQNQGQNNNGASSSTGASSSASASASAPRPRTMFEGMVGETVQAVNTGISSLNTGLVAQVNDGATAWNDVLRSILLGARVAAAGYEEMNRMQDSVESQFKPVVMDDLLKGLDPEEKTDAKGKEPKK